MSDCSLCTGLLVLEACSVLHCSLCCGANALCLLAVTVLVLAAYAFLQSLLVLAAYVGLQSLSGQPFLSPRYSRLDRASGYGRLLWLKWCVAASGSWPPPGESGDGSGEGGGSACVPVQSSSPPVTPTANDLPLRN